MSTFYGNLTGNRGEATRCGTMQSGITASVRSYEGSMTSTMWYRDNKESRDSLMIRINVANNSSSGGTCVYQGTLDGLIAKLA